MVFIERSNSENVTTYSVLQFLSHAVVYGYLFYSIRIRLQEWQYLHYLVLFYLCAFAAAPLMGLIADLSENCHRFAQCGIVLQLCAVFLPYSWDGNLWTSEISIPVKVVFLGLGMGIFQTFAATNILRRDRGHFFDLTVFLACATLGMTAVLAKSNVGYYCLCLLPLLACKRDNAKAFGLSLFQKRTTKKPLVAYISLPLLFFALWMQGYLLRGISAVDRDDTLTVLLTGGAIVFATIVVGLVNDGIGPELFILLVPASVFLPEKLALIGIAVCAAAISTLIKCVSLLFPRTPGLSFGLCNAILFPATWLGMRQPPASTLTLSLIGGIAGAVAIVILAAFGPRFNRKWLAFFSQKPQPDCPAEPNINVDVAPEAPDDLEVKDCEMKGEKNQ